MQITCEVAVEARDADAAHLWHPWSPVGVPERPLMLVKGHGCRVLDDEGRSYLDLRAGTLNATVGYGDRRVVAALASQSAALMTWDLSQASTVPAAQLAARLASMLPTGLERTFFCNSGSEATETAVKVARKWHALSGRPERTWVLSFGEGYHGTTAAAIAATAVPFRRDGSGPLPSGYAHLATPRCSGCATGPKARHECDVPGPKQWEDTIQSLGPDHIAAVLVEPVLSVGGVIVPPAGHLRGLRTLCEKYGILLICDEVATGIGRTGRMFGFEHDLPAGAGPDIVTTSKGLTGGYAPLSAVTVREDIYQMFSRDELLGGLRHGHTTGGHATACAAALAVLDIVEEDDLVAAAAERGSQLLNALIPLAGRAGVRQVRGLGLLVGVEMDSPQAAARTADTAQELGVLVRNFGSVLTLAPPLIITAKEIEAGASAVAQAIAVIGGMAS